MYVSRKGIICRSVKYSESSLILDIFSSDVGMASYIISGVRAKRAKTPASILQVMNQLEFVAIAKNAHTDKLIRIKEAQLAHQYNRIPFEISRRSIGIFLIELIHKCLHTSEDHDSIFEFLRQQFLHLDETNELLTVFHHQFMISLADQLGFGIQGRYSATTPFFDIAEGQFITDTLTNHRDVMEDENITKALDLLVHHDNEPKLTKPMRSELLQLLIRYYQYHIPNFGKISSLDILSSIFTR